MTDKPDYRFKFELVDETTGEAVLVDWVSLSEVDEIGGCETVDHAVARMLRMFSRNARAEYEAKNYQVPA